MKILLILFIILMPILGYAEDYYEVKVPVGVTTSENKVAYAYRALELLRLLHNQKSQDLIDGKITEVEWRTWVREVFKKKQDGLFEVIHDQKELMKQSLTYTIDLEEDFEKKSHIDDIPIE